MKIICEINMCLNSLDNNYTFYENGMIKRIYDIGYNSYEQNKEEFINLNQITEKQKELIIKNCSQNNLEFIRNIFSN